MRRFQAGDPTCFAVTDDGRSDEYLVRYDGGVVRQWREPWTPPKRHGLTEEEELAVERERVLGRDPYKPPELQVERILLADLKSTDHSYWKSIQAELFHLCESEIAARLWKGVKCQRMRAQEKCWRDVVDAEIVKWAEGALRKKSEHDDCVDNYRAARKDRSSQRRRYRRQKDGGCCGSHDFEAKGPDGHMYMLGYNYGH